MSNCANKKACYINYSKLFCVKIRESSKGILAIVPAFIDLTGKRFGNLYVIKRVENNKRNCVQYLTRCEVDNCGNEKVVAGIRLTAKTNPTTHCGCLSSKHRSDAQKKHDLTGKRFGSLSIIDRAKNDKWGKSCWNYICDCGKKGVVEGYRLTRKTYPMIHCGCLNAFIDLTGKRFGSLSIIDLAENDKWGKSCWNYICDCGKKGVVSGDRLRSKKQPMTHCGCLTSQHNSDAAKGNTNRLTHGLTGTAEYAAEQTHKRRMRKQKNNAGADFYDESLKIYKPKLDYCVYCGSTDNSSIDHIMPITKGGTQDPKNLVRSCMFCNQSKHNSFFIDWYTKNKDKRNLRSLDEIIKDLGFDDLEDLTNYQDYISCNAWHNYGLIY